MHHSLAVLMDNQTLYGDEESVEINNGERTLSQERVGPKEREPSPEKASTPKKNEQRRQSNTNDVRKTTSRHSSICIDGLSSTRTNHQIEGRERRQNRGRKKGGYKIGAENNKQLDRKEGTNHHVGEMKGGKVNYELPEYLASKVRSNSVIWLFNAILYDDDWKEWQREAAAFLVPVAWG
ncbi:hypothetical protein M405DRAFT_847955 [Rhizopogon salebrosus TDB-379]|nr:hypothetical protein M405DRAFT_847955 [Rhizopogon salebrosus TDB-379]